VIKARVLRANKHVQWHEMQKVGLLAFEVLLKYWRTKLLEELQERLTSVQRRRVVQQQRVRLEGM
jgi:hypothetical protein